ncbi:Uncharacterised protein [Mycobacterium tuberculosis]|nr:Uncharacterised protein [Mycobacterium tuberculosis]
MVVRPKTPRGDGNFITPDQIGIGVFKSSDPKPREGTETRGADQRPPHPVSRQTQNPERGRKPAKYRLHDTTTTRRQTQNPERGRKPSWWDMDERDYRGRRTQNPERGRKLDAESHRVREVQQSSDPKPREGTETLDDAVAPRPFPAVVRPKTPRGDGNRFASDRFASIKSGRQTQNPERGRKHFERELVHSPPFRSSDPKPREGTET